MDPTEIKIVVPIIVSALAGLSARWGIDSGTMQVMVTAAATLFVTAGTIIVHRYQKPAK